MKPSVDTLTIIVIISTCLAANTYAAKILLVPGDVNSHTMFFTRMAVDLAKLGHATTLLATSSVRVPDFATDDVDNFTFLQYPVNKTAPFLNSPGVSKRMIAMAMSTSPLEQMKMIGELNVDVIRHGEEDCMQLLDNVRLMQEVRKTGYDFAIMDLFAAIACYHTIPYSLGIPFATMSLGLSSVHLFRVPRTAPFPNLVSLSDRPTFLERLSAFIVESMDSGVVSDNTYFMQKYVSDLPHLDTVELFRRQSLWFFVEDLSINFPLPQMPNTVAVGDIMAGAKIRPLSGEIQKFVSKSKSGVIIAAFGSFCDFFPQAINQKLCDAFTEVTKRLGLSVIWKLKEDGFCKDDNILLSPWIPQNDLLADSRIKLLISHGGHNSIVESVYHSKPVIAFPIGLDQPSNAAAAESKGFAIRMNIADFSSGLLVSNIEKLLSDPTYKGNAQRASDILRDRRDTPAQRVSAMIDHVIKYGDQHLRTGAFELSTLQFMMFDIFAALVAAAAVILSTAMLCCYCIYRRCCRHRGTPFQEKPKSQ